MDCKSLPIEAEAMDKDQFAKGMLILRCAYPQSKVDFNQQQVIAVWYELLKDINGDKFLNTVKEIASKEKFFPSVATIREYVNSRPNQMQLPRAVY